MSDDDIDQDQTPPRRSIRIFKPEREKDKWRRAAEQTVRNAKEEEEGHTNLFRGKTSQNAREQQKPNWEAERKLYDEIVGKHHELHLDIIKKLSRNDSFFFALLHKQYGVYGNKPFPFSATAAGKRSKLGKDAWRQSKIRLVKAGLIRCSKMGRFDRTERIEVVVAVLKAEYGNQFIKIPSNWIHTLSNAATVYLAYLLDRWRGLGPIGRLRSNGSFSVSIRAESKSLKMRQDMIESARKELVDAGLITLTRKGYPSRMYARLHLKVIRALPPIPKEKEDEKSEVAEPKPSEDLDELYRRFGYSGYLRDCFNRDIVEKARQFLPKEKVYTLTETLLILDKAIHTVQKDARLYKDGRRGPDTLRVNSSRCTWSGLKNRSG